MCGNDGMDWVDPLLLFVLFARSTITTDFSSDVAGTMNILQKEEKDQYELLAIVSKITRNLNSEKVVCQHSSVRR